MRPASAAASSRGGRLCCGAVRSATFVAKSPCVGSFGRSSSTSVPATSETRAARRSTALGGNREEAFEATELFLGPGGDENVADLEPSLGGRGRVEGAIPLPECNDERTGLLADVEVTDRLAALPAGIGHL